MDAETGVYTLLSSDANLAAQVSTRIYPATRPQGTVVPAIIYSQLDEQQSDTKTGPISNGWTFEVKIIGINNQETRAISKLVKSALNWKEQVITGGTLRTRFSDELDANWDDEQQYFQIVQEYRARKAK